MPQLFVFTAGNPEARQHLYDSIVNPIDDEKVFNNFDESYHEELERIKDEGKGFYARDPSVSKWAYDASWMGCGQKCSNLGRVTIPPWRYWRTSKDTGSLLDDPISRCFDTFRTTLSRQNVLEKNKANGSCLASLQPCMLCWTT
jgi:hypothetical protein